MVQFVDISAVLTSRLSFFASFLLSPFHLLFSGTESAPPHSTHTVQSVLLCLNNPKS